MVFGGVHARLLVDEIERLTPFLYPNVKIDSSMQKLSIVMAGNKSLHAANKAKEDEFYTELSDIENELKHYKEHFKDKVVLCNCDDPRISNFFHYFSYNFEQLGLKKLITTCYKNQERDLFSQNNSERAIWLEYTGDHNGNRVPDPEEIGINYLKGDGDFRSQECIELLKQADIVVTNPPFSLFREYVAQLMKYNKKFVIIGNQNAITYKEIFSYIKANQLWLGSTLSFAKFKVPDYYEPKPTRFWIDETGQKWRSMGNICWFTNLDIAKRHEEIILYKSYNEQEYPQYDNYNAINVNKVAEIPMDYDGVMGVPITFLDKYNPNQFEILSSNDYRKSDSVPFKAHGLIKDKDGAINGKPTYARILIRRKQPHIAETEQTSSTKAYQIIEPEMSMVAEPELEYGKK